MHLIATEAAVSAPQYTCTRCCGVGVPSRSGDRLLFLDVSLFNRLRVYEMPLSILFTVSGDGARAITSAGVTSSSPVPASTVEAASAPAAVGAAHTALASDLSVSNTTRQPAFSSQPRFHASDQQAKVSSGGISSQCPQIHAKEALLQPPYHTRPMLSHICSLSPFFFSDLDITQFGIALYGRLPPSVPAVFLLKESNKRLQLQKKHLISPAEQVSYNEHDKPLQRRYKRWQHIKQQQLSNLHKLQQPRHNQQHMKQRNRCEEQRRRTQTGKQHHKKVRPTSTNSRPLRCRRRSWVTNCKITKIQGGRSANSGDDTSSREGNISRRDEQPGAVSPPLGAGRDLTQLQLRKTQPKHREESHWVLLTPQIWRDTQQLSECSEGEAWSRHTSQLWEDIHHQMGESTIQQQGKEKRKQLPRTPFLCKAGMFLPAVNTDFTSPFLLLSVQSAHQPPLQVFLDMRKERLLLPPSIPHDRLLRLQKEAQLNHRFVMDVVQQFLRLIPPLPSSVLEERRIASIAHEAGLAASCTAIYDAAETAPAPASRVVALPNIEFAAAAPTGGAGRGVRSPVSLTTGTCKVSELAAAPEINSCCSVGLTPDGAGAAAETHGLLTAGASGPDTSARTALVYVPSRDGRTAIPITLLLSPGASSVTIADTAASFSSSLARAYPHDRTSTEGEYHSSRFPCVSGSSSSINHNTFTGSTGSVGRSRIVSVADNSSSRTEVLTRSPYPFTCVHAASPVRFLVLCYGAYKQPQQIGFSPLISLLLTPQAATDIISGSPGDKPGATASAGASCVPWGVAIAHTRGEGAASGEGISCGRGIRKSEGITDLEDVLQWLLACNLTRRDLLVVKACSAGGVLAASLYSLQAMRQYAAAVVLKQPFLDPLNSFMSADLERQQLQRQQHHRQLQAQHLQCQHQMKCVKHQVREDSQTPVPHFQQPSDTGGHLLRSADGQKRQQIRRESQEYIITQRHRHGKPSQQEDTADWRKRLSCFGSHDEADDRDWKEKIVKFPTCVSEIIEGESAKPQLTREDLSSSSVAHQEDIWVEKFASHGRLVHVHTNESDENGIAAAATARGHERDSIAPGSGVTADGDFQYIPADALVALEVDEWGDPFAFTAPLGSRSLCSTHFSSTVGLSDDPAVFCPTIPFEEEVPVSLLSLLSYSAIDNFHPPRCFTPPTLVICKATTQAQEGLDAGLSAISTQRDTLCCSRCGSWRCVGAVKWYQQMNANEAHDRHACSNTSSSSAELSISSSKTANNCSNASNNSKRRTPPISANPAPTNIATSALRAREWPRLWLSASLGDTTVGCWQSCNFLLRLQAMDRLRLQQEENVYSCRNRRLVELPFQERPKHPQSQADLQQPVQPGAFYTQKRLKIKQRKESCHVWQSSKARNFKDMTEWGDHDSSAEAHVFFRLDGAEIGHLGSSSSTLRTLEDAEEACFLFKATEIDSSGE